ncbi:MAG: hypothetical protein KBS64_01625 [Treponema sp.]|nr:hypothetical protein [Candidatus Treponema equi]
MRHDRHSRRHNNGNWKNNRHDHDSQKNSKPVFKPTIKTVTEEQVKESEAAILRFKNENQPVCPVCGEIIRDMSTAVKDPKSDSPLHFDCTIGLIQKDNPLSQGEKIAYIGQGRFAVLYFANVHDSKHFQIRKIIDWEEKEKKPLWRDEMSELYSKVH